MANTIFLLLNLVLAFYNAGTIWAHEIDIFRSWKLVSNPEVFHNIQKVHWKKLPYWVFIPVGISFIGSVLLFWYHPEKIPNSTIWIAFTFQFLSHFLTAICWGPWQARLSKDELGNKSPSLKSILKTHWIRTLLINAYALMLLYMTIQSLS